MKDKLGGVREERPRRETVAYQHLFAGATGPAVPVVVGLTALWATERCYLEAWRYARSQTWGVEEKDEDQVQTCLRTELIPNWTDEEFVAFVDRIGGLLDEWAERLEMDGSEWRACEDVWVQALGAEEAFWPKVEE